MASNSPVQFRQYMARFTLEHLAAGMTPLRQMIKSAEHPEGVPMMFTPAMLQFRFKEIVHDNGVKKMVWSEWETVGFVREGVDDEPITE